MMGTFSNLPSVPNTEKKCAVLVENVNKTYGDNVRILRDMSMHVEEGVIYGLLGSSGCGKTSILSCVVGLKSFNSGNIHVLGNKVENANGVIAQDIGYMPQDVALYEELTVTEMMKYYAKLYHMTKDKYEDQIALLEDLLNLPGYGSRRIANLSGGQMRRVSLALTLLHSPKLLILDEPTVGLDPLLRDNIWKYLHKLANTNKTTIIITTHYIEEVRHANTVGLMRKGTLLVEDDPVALMQAHNTSLLEDVVLNVCRRDRNNRQKSFEVETQKLQSVHVPQENNNKFCKWFQREKRQIPNKTNNIEKENENKMSSIKIDSAVTSSEKDNNASNEKNLRQTLIRSAQKTLAYSQIVWINFVHNPIFILLLLFLPPLQLFSTGVVIGVEPKYTPLGIVNHEILSWRNTCFEKISRDVAYDNDGNNTCILSKLSCKLIKQLTDGIFIEPVEFTSSEEARLAVTRGDIRGYIQIPHNYSSHIVERAVTKLFANTETIDGTTVTLHFDMSEYVTIFVVLTELFRTFQDFVNELTTTCDFPLKLIEVPFFYREPVYGNMDVSARDYALPALIAGILFEISFAVAPLVFIADLKKGTMERSRVAGLKSSELIMGLFLTMTILTVIQAIICYVSLGFGLGFDIQGSVFAYLCVCLATTFCAGALGLLVGITYKDELLVAISGIFLIPLLMIYAGILRPVEVIPHPFRSLIFYFFPTAAIVEPFRFIMNRGVSLTHPMVWPGVLVTCGWGFIFSVLSLISLKTMKR